MSYLAQDWAILQQAGDPTAKAVLIALAWSLNTKDGLCCPSLATLAKLSDVKQRHTVLDAVVRLEKAGLIRRTMAKAKKRLRQKNLLHVSRSCDLGWCYLKSNTCYLRGNGVLPQR